MLKNCVYMRNIEFNLIELKCIVPFGKFFFHWFDKSLYIYT